MKVRILSLLAIMLLALPTFAQESTPDPSGVTTLGAIDLVLPEGWLSFAARDGGIILSNVDLQSITTNTYPAETVIVQIQTATLDQIPDFDATEVTPLTVFNAIAPDEVKPLIVSSEINGIAVATADNNTDNSSNRIYVRLLGDNGFALIITGDTVLGALAPQQTAIESIVSSIALNVSAPIPDGLADRYTDIPTGITEEGFPFLGNADAAVTVVEVSSFGCGHCADFHDLALPVLLDEVKTGDVRFVYVPYFGTGSIPASDRASRAFICAIGEGKHWEMHDVLFSWQSFGVYAFVQERIVAGAEALGLDMDTFSACLYSEETTASLETAFNYASGIEGFTGTPTVLVNGVITSWAPLETLQAAIAAAKGN